MKLLFATRSAGKQREVRRVLEAAGVEVVFPDEVGIGERLEEERLEVHDSFSANAEAKAAYFAKRRGLPTVADDSGLEVLSLGGAPGVRSKRWAGAEGRPAEVDAANNREMLRRLAGATGNRRRAQYRAVLAYLPSPGAPVEIFEGRCTGTITTEPRGDAGFGYDPYFLSDDLEKTFGEATAEEKDAVSHRGRALEKLVERLRSEG